MTTKVLAIGGALLIISALPVYFLYETNFFGGAATGYESTGPKTAAAMAVVGFTWLIYRYLLRSKLNIDRYVGASLITLAIIATIVFFIKIVEIQAIGFEAVFNPPLVYPEYNYNGHYKGTFIGLMILTAGLWLAFILTSFTNRDKKRHIN